MRISGNYIFSGENKEINKYILITKNISSVKNSFRKNFLHIPILQEILKKKKKSVEFRNTTFNKKDLNINLPMIQLTL